MTRQAEPVMVNPYITPTIADLDVSQTKETITETFDNDLTLKSKFDNNYVEAWKEATLAKMMREFSSDVIVAPVYNITTSKDMKNVTIEISGYPAKYINFRSMQASDSTTMRVHGIEIAKGGMTDYKRITEIKSKINQKRTETIEKMNRLGDFSAIEAGVNMGLISGDNMILDVQGVIGEQFSNYFGFGVGTGFFTRAFKSYDRARAISMPLFVNARGYFFESGVTPYYSVDFGFLLPIRKAKNEPNPISEYGIGKYIVQDMNASLKGFTFSPEIGIAFGKFNVGVEWKFFKSHYKVTYDYDDLPDNITSNEVEEFMEDEHLSDNKIKESDHAFFLKLGLTF